MPANQRSGRCPLQHFELRALVPLPESVQETVKATTYTSTPTHFKDEPENSLSYTFRSRWRVKRPSNVSSAQRHLASAGDIRQCPKSRPSRIHLTRTVSTRKHMHLTTNVRDAPDALQHPLTLAGILVFTVSVTKFFAAG
jgi:hypothetical protein